jgi:UDP-N-acetylmuramyl tripeptide synthase
MTIRLRTTAAILAGRTASLLSRGLRLGGGTNLPGRVARRIAPDVLQDLAAALPKGVVLLSGTNGKTTTTRMIATILEHNRLNVLHNRAGANLITGLTATALTGSSPFGRPASHIGLFETDEAALPAAIAETKPRLVVIHNLFRDQLDRYGEVDTLAGKWKAALATLPAESMVLLEADDPAVADLGSGLTAQVYYYGLDDVSHAVGAGGHIADSQFCRRCGTRYDYAQRFYAHVGHYHCPNCGHERPKPHFSLQKLTLEGTSSSRLYITYPGGALEVHLPIPGLYNAINALAATAATILLDMPPASVRDALERFSAAFGRIERVQAGPNGAPMLIALIKNPVGASETVRMLVGNEQEASKSFQLWIAINDLDADGTDVSWLWDAEFERLGAVRGDGQPVVERVTVSGTRAYDMAVRLKYAGIDPERIVVEPNLASAVDLALQALPTGETLYMLPTYTAMLELRAEFAQRGWVRQFWQD